MKIKDSLDFGGNQALGMRAENRPGVPTPLGPGQFYYDTTAGLMRWWNTVGWVNPLDRGNHSGTQPSSSISDFTEAAQDAVAAAVNALTTSGLVATYNDTLNSLSFRLAGERYFMPAPTGVKATDDATWAAFIASSATTAEFNFAGTYNVTGGMSLNRSVAFVNKLQRGEVWVRFDNTSTQTKLFTGGDIRVISEGMGYDLNASSRSVASTVGFEITGMGHYCRWTNNWFKGCKDSAGTGSFISKFGSTAAQRTKGFVLDGNLFESSTGRCVTAYGCEMLVRGNTFYGYNTANTVSQPALQLVGGTVEGPCKGAIIYNRFETTVDAYNSFAVETTYGQPSQYLHEFWIAGNEMTGGDNRNGGVGISGAFSNTVVEANRFVKIPANLSSGLELAGSRIKVLHNLFVCDRTTSAGGPASQLVSVAQHTQLGWSEGSEIAGNTIHMLAQAGHDIPGGERGIIWFGTRGMKVHDNTVFINSTANYTAFQPGDNHGPGRNDHCYNNHVYCTGAKQQHRGINVNYSTGFGPVAGSDYGDNCHFYGNTIVGVDVGILWASGANDINCTVRGNNAPDCNVVYADWVFNPATNLTTTNRLRLSYPDGVAKRYVIGDGSSATITVAHNLLTRDLRITARLAATGQSVNVTWQATSDNSVNITFPSAPAINNAVVLLSDG